MTARTLLFIDFDGVICDSASECLYSSWLAYDQLSRATTGIAKEPAVAPSMPMSLRKRFLMLRPFIRAGDDYVLIQRLLAEERMPSCQKEFDQARQEAGSETLSHYTDALNLVRKKLLSQERNHWLRLNPLYKGMNKLLESTDWQVTRILSTKEPQYIEAIIEFHGLTVPAQAIVHAADGSKLSIVTAAINAGEWEHAVLIDDQIDHLLGNTDERISVHLATWGYSKPEWETTSQVPTLDLHELDTLVTRRQNLT